LPTTVVLVQAQGAVPPPPQQPVQPVVQVADVQAIPQLVAVLNATAADGVPAKALFTSRVLEGMGGDYFISRNFSDRLFTSLGLRG
jgi:hypothetical protein